MKMIPLWEGMPIKIVKIAPKTTIPASLKFIYGLNHDALTK